jgi:pimeloyl-ACP methyl ester carboxylesterase
MMQERRQEQTMTGRESRSSAEYFTGATTTIAAQADQRFSYSLYIPKVEAGDPERYRLVVMQHGTARTATRYRDAMIGFADEQRVVVLAPLFPAGIIDPDDLHNFKFLEYRGIRFDLVLLAMIEEVSRRVPLETDRFLLHGFSGGGQFAHRFLYAHPQRLLAASIGAPGRVTLLDDTTPWWLGTKDFARIFGTAPDIAEIRKVPIQLVVGDLDVEGWEINNPHDSNWLPGLEKQGKTRIERLETLQKNLDDHGIATRFDLVPGAAHQGLKMIDVVCEFFASVLARTS